MPTEYDYMKEGKELGWELEKPKKLSKAEITFQEMEVKLLQAGFQPTELDGQEKKNSPVNDILYADVQSFKRENKREKAYVTMFLSKPHSSIRSNSNPPRHSIEIKLNTNSLPYAIDKYGTTLGQIYGFFGVNGKPIGENAEEIQKQLNLF
jgi:hypothetical protein